MSTIVITGASMGIGRALALAWAKRGATVVLSARGAAALASLEGEVRAKGGRAIALTGDVTDDAHRERLVARAIDETGALDVLVNNAGRGYYGAWTGIELGELRSLFELNVIAPLHLAQLAAPHLEKTRGAVVMLSSIAGVVAAPRYAAYSATKFALEGMSMAMRSELGARGVRVVVVRPGPVATPFRENATKTKGETGYSTPDPRAQSAETVAEMTVRAVERGAPVLETSAYVRAVSAAQRLVPPGVRYALSRMV